MFQNMRKFIKIFMFLAVLSPCCCFAKPLVLVSVSPQKYLVERLAGGLVEVDTIAPANADPHTYEITYKEIAKIKRSSAWIRLGEGFEYSVKKIASKSLLIVDNREGLDLIGGCCSSHCHGHSHLDSCDTHIWLSPKNLKIIIFQISEMLKKILPSNCKLIDSNYLVLLKEINKLDSNIKNILKNKNNSTILVAHPAYNYFCRDYDLKQISIEQEGREPSFKQIIELLKESKKQSIKRVFCQNNSTTKSGEKIAKELDAEVVFLDPYAENVIDNLTIIAEAFIS